MSSPTLPTDDVIVWTGIIIEVLYIYIYIGASVQPIRSLVPGLQYGWVNTLIYVSVGVRQGVWNSLKAMYEHVVILNHYCTYCPRVRRHLTVDFFFFLSNKIHRQPFGTNVRLKMKSLRNRARIHDNKVFFFWEFVGHFSFVTLFHFFFGWNIQTYSINKCVRIFGT